MFLSHGEDDVTELVSLDGSSREVTDVFNSVEDQEKVEQDLAELLSNVEVQLDALTMARTILFIHVML